MFERFTDEARRVIVSGQEAARQRGQVEIGTEHVLLGLVGEHDCDGARALERLEISLAAVRVQIDELVGCGEGVNGHTDPIPFAPPAKRVLELSARRGGTARTPRDRHRTHPPGHGA